MLQVGRKFKFLSVLLLLLFTLLNLRANVLRDALWRHPHVFQNFDEQAVVIGQRFKDICGLYCLATLSPRPLHRPFKEVSRIWSNTEALTNMLLAAGLQSLIDSHFYNYWIKRQITHRRIEQIRLLMHQSFQNMFDCNVVLIPLPRLIQRMFEYALPALTKLVFIGSQINHLFAQTHAQIVCTIS